MLSEYGEDIVGWMPNEACRVRRVRRLFKSAVHRPTEDDHRDQPDRHTSEEPPVTSRRVHLATAAVGMVVAVALGKHPVFVLPLVVGVLLPELDTVRESVHRSWLLHTFLLPALAYLLLARTGVLQQFPVVLETLNFVSLGMALHFIPDFVYPRKMTHEGAEWPVRPTGFSAPWGLLWLGLAWFVQWFVYLVPEFIPWLGGL